MANPVKPLRDPSQGVQKQFPVAIVLEDRFAVVSPGGDMVEGASYSIRRGRAMAGDPMANQRDSQIQRPDPRRDPLTPDVIPCRPQDYVEGSPVFLSSNSSVSISVRSDQHACSRIRAGSYHAKFPQVR